MDALTGSQRISFLQNSSRQSVHGVDFLKRGCTHNLTRPLKPHLPFDTPIAATMALDNGIEMESLGPAADFDVTFVPSKKEIRRYARQATRTYKERFASILTEGYDDKRSWWEAAEALLKKDEEFEVKVCCILH